MTNYIHDGTISGVNSSKTEKNTISNYSTSVVVFKVGEEKKMEEIDPLTVASEVIDLSSTKSPVWEYTCSKH